MGNKSRNHKRRQRKNVGKNIECSNERKERLIALLDKVETPKLEEKLMKDEDIESEFSTIMKKFGARMDSDTVNEEIAVIRPGLFEEQKEEKGNELQEQLLHDSDEEQEDESMEKHTSDISRRQRKLANKPSMVELKAATSYPELIEWYDRDAEYPYFNAKIKTSHNIVSIPRNWQMKRGYLAGRSVLEQKPFELPEIIKFTDIEELRQTLPNGQEKDNDKLKDLTRAKVQPKLGTLDLDYKKLYDVFFRLRKDWKPPLLPYGDLYYENRNLENELRWKEIRSKYIPGRLSSRLREVLGLPEGMLPPWCKEMKEHGLPKSYPGIKVCGINWDISNLTNQTYASWPGNKSVKANPKKFFGSLVSLEELDNFNEQIDQAKYDSSDSEDENMKEDNDEDAVQVDHEEAGQKEVLESIDNDPIKRIVQEEHRPLYTVLREHGVEDRNNIESKRYYDLSRKRPSDNSNEDNINKRKKITEEEPDFRF